MRLLLDTHVLLWTLSDPERLGREVARAIVDPENEVVASAVNALEIAIKQSLGQFDLPGPAETWLPEALERTGIGWIPLTLQVALRVRSLPWHHRDPFDRLLVSQSMEGYTLVTHDEQLRAYRIPVLWT